MSQTILILLDVSKREQSCNSSSATSSKAAVESSELTAVVCECVSLSLFSLSVVFLSIAAKVSTVFQQLQTDETPAKPAEDSQTNGRINTNLTPQPKKK
jgi:hypothetical protein